MTAIKYSREMLESAVADSSSFAGVLRELGLKQAGGTQAHISRRIKQFGIDTSHFTGQSHMKGRTALARKTAEEILVVLPEGSYRPKVTQLRRALIESGIEETCAMCGIGVEWNGKKLVLEVDHVDGDFLNNRIENLRFACPNCHSQEETTNRPWKSTRA